MARTSRKSNSYIQAPTAKTTDFRIYNTALYARLSRESVREDTIEFQLLALHKFIENKPQFKFCGEFVDNGFTGTNFDRPGFQKMFRLVQAGEIDCIIVKDFSRLGRDYLQTGELLEIITAEYGLRVIALKDNYDSLDNSASYDTRVALTNLMNDLYAKDISRKVCTAIQGKLERGDFIGDYAPYGYQKDPANKNHLIPDPELVPVVNRIFQMRADGMGIGSIANVLNSEDIPCPGRYRYEHGIITNNNKKGSALLWNRHVLTDMLKNVVYIGNLAQAKWRQALYKGEKHRLTQEDEWVVVENTHAAIVPKELFDKVQEVNAQQKESYKRNYGRYDYLPKGENPFGCHLVCADCGARIKLHRSISPKKDKAYFTYKCPTYVDHHGNQCSDKSVSQADLEKAVLTTIQAHLKLFMKHKAVIEKLQEKDMRMSRRYQALEEIKRCEQKLQQKESLRTEAYMDYKRGEIQYDEYQSYKESYTRDIDALSQKITELRTEVENETAMLDHFKNWIALVDRYKDMTTLTKENVDAFVQTIKLHDNGQIEVTLNYMDEFNSARALYNERREEVA